MPSEPAPALGADLPAVTIGSGECQGVGRFFFGLVAAFVLSPPFSRKKKTHTLARATLSNRITEGLVFRPGRAVSLDRSFSKQENAFDGLREALFRVARSVAWFSAHSEAGRTSPVPTSFVLELELRFCRLRRLWRVGFAPFDALLFCDRRRGMRERSCTGASGKAEGRSHCIVSGAFSAAFEFG